MKKKNTSQETFNALKRPYLNAGSINEYSIEVEDVCMHDYPDFCDAYISYAEFKDGTVLTDAQLEQLNDEEHDMVYSAAWQSMF